MIEEKFSITALENANKKLGEILKRYSENKQDDALRDSVIKRFEFTYSTVLGTLRKYFYNKAFLSDDVNTMTFNDMIRTANQFNLLNSNLEKWTDFRQARNMTSHAYDENIAMKVVEIVPDFYNEVSFLILKLNENNGKN